MSEIEWPAGVNPEDWELVATYEVTRAPAYHRLADFIKRRLDEEEASALGMAAAFAGVAGWVIYENGGEFDFTVTAGQLSTEAVADMWREDAATWIAGHDPARALREVEAKRAILADCERAMSKQTEFNADHARHGSPFPSPHANLAFRTLLQLASIWNGHPDYRPEWAPTEPPTRQERSAH